MTRPTDGWKDLDFAEKCAVVAVMLLSGSVFGLAIAFATQLVLCGCPITK